MAPELASGRAPACVDRMTQASACLCLPLIGAWLCLTLRSGYHALGRGSRETQRPERCRPVSVLF